MQFLIPIYVILSIICGLSARETGLKFWGGFFFAILVTPVIAILVIFFLKWLKHRKEKPKQEQFVCPYAKEKLE